MSAHSEHGSGGGSHGSVTSYVFGLILSIVLTAIPFGMVMAGDFSAATTGIVIVICAIAQVLVQMVFFLHLDMSSRMVWNTMSGVYTAFIVLFLVIGTVWIFEHLHHNMLMGH